jgi:hypothetical protein
VDLPGRGGKNKCRRCCVKASAGKLGIDLVGACTRKLKRMMVYKGVSQCEKNRQEKDFLDPGMRTKQQISE